MTGKPAEMTKCPTCGGPLESGKATIPYILQDNTVVVVKQVPAAICLECGEAFTTGQVTDQVLALIQQFKQLDGEVAVINYSERTPA